MDLINGLQHQLVYANLDDFYLLSRTALVKDEKNYDKFDRAFSAYFKGLEDLHGLLESLIPDEWLRHEFEKSLSPEQLKEIESLGGLEKLIEAFKKAKEEAEKIVTASREEIRNEKAKAIIELKDKVAEISFEIAEKVLSEKLSSSDKQSDTVKRALSEIRFN